MSSPSEGGAPPLYDPALNQKDYSFSGRVLLTAVVILAILTVVFVLIRLLLFQFVARGRGSLLAGVRRSFGSFGRSGRHGLDASALAALPLTTYRRKDEGAGGSTSTSTSTSTSGAASVTSTTECAVCLSELEDGVKVRALPSCGHVFHVDCVDAWLRSRTTCPVCRAEVAPKGRGDAQPSSAPTPPPPALFGAGGTLVVTVEGGVAETRGARTSVLGSGQPAGAVG